MKVHSSFIYSAARISAFSIYLLFFLTLIGSGCESPDQTPAEASSQSSNQFVSVFNGVDLTGWTGDLDGYAVEDGMLVCQKEKGGNLYIDQEFADFHLKFSFRLEPNGNNGLGIRAEKGKDAAYYGMEIQILDDYAEAYAELKPYQYHGSIYGVVPARRGFLKTAGEWNHEEVIAKGNHIQVILNGTTIVDADIAEAASPQTIDEREHPGLFNASGYIGFLGHDHRVEFKDIYIKVL